MVRKRILKGQEVPKLHITDVMIEFYNLESILNKSDQKNYIIIRLVTIIEQFCRGVIRNKLPHDTNTNSMDSIELQIPFIDNLIHAVSVEKRQVYKEEIMAASYKFQNTADIEKEFPQAFQGLNKNDYANLFYLRHRLVHTIEVSPTLEITKCYYMVEKLMKNILEKHKTNNIFYVLKIFALQKLQKSDAIKQCYYDAKDEYDKKISANPKNLETLHEWGFILGKFEKYTEAIHCYNEIIKIDPDNDWVYDMKVAMLEKLNDRSGAINCLNEIIEKYPDDPAVYYNKGITLYDFFDYEGAIEACNNALRFDENMSEAYYLKGKSLQMLEEYQESVNCLNKCIQLNDQEDPNVFLDFGLSLQQIGDSVKATEYLVKSLFLFENSAFYHTHKKYYFGMAWQGLGIHHIAVNYFEKVLEAESSYTEARLGIGESFLSMRKYTDAIQFFDAVLIEEPENKQAQRAKIRALREI